MLISSSLYMVKHYWSFCYQWHIHLMSVVEVKTQTRLKVLFTSGSLLTWGKPLDALPGISPMYSPAIYSQSTISPFLLQTSHHDRVCLFLQKVDRWRKEMALMWADINICPLLQQFQIPSLSQVELSSLNSLRVWGKRQQFHHNIAFLLVLANEEATGDRQYGLLTIWVNPSQARVPSIEEVVGKLTTWASSGPNWPYTLMWLHKGTHHAPLHQGGALGHPTSMRGRGDSLQAYQPTRSLPTPHCQPTSCLPNQVEQKWRTHYNFPTKATGQWHKSYQRQAHLPGNWHPTIPGRGNILKDTTYWWGLHHHYSQPLQVHPPKLEGEGSMTMEVRNLLSWAVLNTSGHGSENSTLRRPNPVVVLTPPPLKP